MEVHIKNQFKSQSKLVLHFLFQNLACVNEKIYMHAATIFLIGSS